MSHKLLLSVLTHYIGIPRPPKNFDYGVAIRMVKDL